MLVRTAPFEPFYRVSTTYMYVLTEEIKRNKNTPGNPTFPQTNEHYGAGCIGLLT